MDASKVRHYIDHFLPRDVIGPVLIVFSLEGVIDGIFSLYVPSGYATLGWGAVFVLSVAIVAYWGAHDEEDLEALQDRIEEIEADEADSTQGT